MNHSKQTAVRVRTLCECAVCLALSTALSFVALWKAPLGGEVTLCSMLPILICAWRNGPGWGFSTAFLHAAIQLLFGLGNLAYIPTTGAYILGILFDYLIPFTALGVAGLFRIGKNDILRRGRAYAKVYLSLSIAAILRAASHIFVGAVIWYDITKAGAWNDTVFRYGAFLYSTIYNGSFLLPEFVLLFAVSAIVPSLLFRLPEIKTD